MNLSIVKPAYAAICNKLTDPTCSGLQTKHPDIYFNNVIQAVVDIFLIVGVIYFVWHFLTAGYHFISSQGDAKKIEAAQHEITYAFVGLAVIFALFAVLKFVGAVFGIDITNIQWPSL